MGLDVGANLSVNDQRRPGRARVLTAPFQAILGIETSISISRLALSVRSSSRYHMHMYVPPKLM